MIEVGRIEAEIEKKEELFNNHGHDKNFFKAPKLRTSHRNTVRKAGDSKDSSESEGKKLEREK